MEVGEIVWNYILGDGFKDFLNVHPYLGKMNPFWLAHIFQMGGSTTNQICFLFKGTLFLDF